jgi:hypothetical protein
MVRRFCLVMRSYRSGGCSHDQADSAATQSDPAVTSMRFDRAEQERHRDGGKQDDRGPPDEDSMTMAA